MRLVANFLKLGLIPIAGAFSNAVTAAALTEFLGRYLDTAMDHPDLPPPVVTMKDLKSAIKDALKRDNKKKAEA